MRVGIDYVGIDDGMHCAVGERVSVGDAGGGGGAPLCMIWLLANLWCVMLLMCSVLPMLFSVLFMCML